MLLIRRVLSHSLHSEPREQCQEANNGRLFYNCTCGTVAYLLFCNTKRNSVSNTRSPMSFHRHADLLFSAFCRSMFMLTDCNLARFDNISHTFYIPAMGSCHAFRLLWFHHIACMCIMAYTLEMKVMINVKWDTVMFNLNAIIHSYLHHIRCEFPSFHNELISDSCKCVALYIYIYICIYNRFSLFS